MSTGGVCPAAQVTMTLVVGGSCATPLMIRPITKDWEPVCSATVYVPSPKPHTCTVPVVSVKKPFVTFNGSVTSNSQLGSGENPPLPSGICFSTVRQNVGV